MMTRPLRPLLDPEETTDTKPVFPNISTLPSLQLPVIVQCLCWKSQEIDKKEVLREEEMDLSPKIPAAHSALHWQRCPYPISHGRSGSASALFFRQQIPVLPVFPGFFLPGSIERALGPCPTPLPHLGCLLLTRRAWEQWIKDVRMEESDYPSLFREEFSAQPLPDCIFPKLIPFKEVINIQNILA